MKKALAILGDAWHAHSVIYWAIASKMENKGYKVERVLDYDVPFDRFSEYDIIILSRYAIDDYKTYKNINTDVRYYWLTSEHEELFERYVENGGRLFIHHDGFALYKKDNAICRLAKSFFITHPPIGPIKVKPVEEHEELNVGIEIYEINDEEYVVEMSEGDTNVFLESYSEKNGKFAQGWYHDYGKGKVIVFIPGHDHSVLKHPMVDKGISNIIDWLDK